MTGRYFVLILLVCATLVGSCGWESSTEVTIGAILPLSGRNAHYGASIKKGLVLALADELAKPQQAQHTIRILYRDSRTDPDLAVEAMRELIDEHKVPLVITVSSGVTLACGREAQRREVVLISPAASAPEISELGPWVFRNTSSDVVEGFAMANYCIQNKLSPVAVSYMNDIYGQGLSKVFRGSFEEKGGLVNTFEPFEKNANDFSTLLDELLEKKPRAVYFPGYYGEIMSFLNQAREAGLETKFLFPSSIYINDVLREAPHIVEGVIFTQPSYDPHSTEEPVPAFVESFHKRYAETPDIFSAAAYDVAKLIIAAVDVGGETSEDIRDTLNALENFQGVTGETSFDENGDVSRIPHISTVRNGSFSRIR